MTDRFLERLPWPDGTPITNPFGPNHFGLDGGCEIGTELIPGAPASVIQGYNDGSYGKAVFLDYHNGLYGCLAHNSELRVSVGDEVSAFQVVALSGWSGYVQPPGPAGRHSHFQLCTDSRFPRGLQYNIDPALMVISEEDMEAIEQLQKDVALLRKLLGENGVDAVCYPGTEECFPPNTPVVPEGTGEPVHLLTGPAAVRYCELREFSFPLGLRRTQIALRKHIDGGN